jgi:hypothetical protein
MNFEESLMSLRSFFSRLDPFRFSQTEKYPTSAANAGSSNIALRPLIGIVAVLTVAVVWFHTTGSGATAAGEKVLPVTSEIVEPWKQVKEEDARQPPERIVIEKYAPFDALTGKARVWYWRKDDNGDFEFYDGPGFHPQTGEPLALISRDVLAAYRQHKSEQTKCYIITRDTVLYRDTVGQDPETGKQCRLKTPQILERLREYEKGRRPKRIELTEPEFFDPGTGEAIIWYSKSATGRIELFDLMGFHPQSGEELLPVTKAVYEDWKRFKSMPVIPKKVDPGQHQFFDVRTGEPRTWHWRSEKKEYEFYDGPGFHPMTGDPLIVVTKETLEKWKEDVEREEQRYRDEQRDKEEREKKNRKEAEQQEAERQKRAEERWRQQQSVKRCDDLAANPNDPRRATSAGVPYEVLALQANEAIDACELAVKQAPNELRLQYQLARAFQTNRDRQKAFPIHQRLVNRNYPAAYDNLGWLLINERQNYSEAVRLFRRGVQLGDPDSMVSLAEMIDKGRTTPLNLSETKLALYGRAAQLGHQGAAQALKSEQEKAAQHRAQQIEAQRRATDMMRMIFQNIR